MPQERAMKRLLQHIDDRSIPVKLGIMLAVPLLMLGYVALEYLPQREATLERAQEDIEAILLAQRLNQVAHELAVERGLSAGYIGSSGGLKKLLSQRQRVDLLVDELMEVLAQIRDEAGLGLRLDQGDVAILRASLAQRGEIRRLVDQRSSHSFSRSFDYYSDGNMTLLHLIQDLVNAMSDQRLMNRSDSVNRLLWIKERAGQERGRLNHFFSSGEISVQASIEVNHAIQDQHIKLQEFMNRALPDQQVLYQVEMKRLEQERVMPYRKIFFSRLKKQEMLEELRALIGFGGMIHVFKNYVIRGDEGLRQRFYQLYREVQQVLDRYQQAEGVTEEEKGLLQIVRQNVDAYHDNIEWAASYDHRAGVVVEIDREVKVDDGPALAALEQLSRETNVDASDWFEGATYRIDRINHVARQLGDALLQWAEQRAERLAGEYYLYRNSFLMLLLFTALVAFYLWRQLSRNITQVVTTIRQIEQSGDLSQRVEVRSRDEIGEIGEALNGLCASHQQAIGEAVGVSEAVADSLFGTRMVGAYRGDLDQLKEGINRSADCVEHYTHAKDEFMASMSHELRTPLTAIIGSSELLSEQEQDYDKRKLIRSIEMAGRSQLALVNDILDMSKIESGKFTIEDCPYDLYELVHEVEHIFSGRIQDAGLRFGLELKLRPEHKLLGDGQRVGQILINLIGNAIKFTAEGEIGLVVWRSGEQLHFKVEDSGIGMPPEVIERLFRRFEQADGSISRRFGGSGLGLYISGNLAQLMGGSIEVASEEGKGSVFQLNIPYRESNESVEPPEVQAVRSQLVDPRFHGHVLVAEDTPELQVLERRILESMGLTVEVANHGGEALELATRGSFDLVLMDMQMPEMDGIEATRAIRRAGIEVPVVALTANVMQKHRDAFKAAGCNGFLGKPIDREVLKQVLGQYLSQEEKGKAVLAADPIIDLMDDELMAIFVERTTEHRNLLQQAFDDQDWEQVRFVSHTIKGSGTSFGYPELTRLGKVVNDAIERHDETGIREQVTQLIAALNKILG